jgi:hypothetical protein
LSVGSDSIELSLVLSDASVAIIFNYFEGQI